jgi:hypothetical protein
MSAQWPQLRCSPRAEREHIRRCRWLVAARNRHSDWSQGQEEHGAAFLVAYVTGIKAAPKGNGSRRDHLRSRRCGWTSRTSGQRTIGIRLRTHLAELNINPDVLEWKEFSETRPPSASATDQSTTGTSIEEARMMIARAFSIQPSAAENFDRRITAGSRPANCVADSMPRSLKHLGEAYSKNRN